MTCAYCYQPRADAELVRITVAQQVNQAPSTVERTVCRACQRRYLGMR